MAGSSREGGAGGERAPGDPAVLVPADHQPSLPTGRLLVHETPSEEAVPLDVVFVGGGPAGLAGAIELARLARADAEAGGSVGELEIGVLEKAGALGEHCLSGAVVNPREFRELFPDRQIDDFPFRGPVEDEAVYYLTRSRAIRIPAPPTMKNEGNHVASLCECVRWLGERAEELGVNLFPGFPVGSLLVDDQAVVGVRTVPSGLDRQGEPGPGHVPAMELSSRVTVLAEGTRGALTQAWLGWQGIGSENPQIYALGVKELWEVPRTPDRVVHTLGWPLPSDVFGGSFLYPMGPDVLAVGLVVGLDYPDAGLDVHQLLQVMKEHPLFRPWLEEGSMVEWGAKTIPEGGHYSVPERLHGPGAMVVGDGAGLVDVPSLKGIHYAMRSGILAARAAFRALETGDTSRAGLRSYTEAMDDSYVREDLRRTRNMRLAFKEGLVSGSVKAGLMTLTGGAFPGNRIPVEEDAAEPRSVGPGVEPPGREGGLAVSKEDAVFRSGNRTRDDVPDHLLVGEDVPSEVAEFYVHVCPAGVYEREGDRLVVRPPNCIDCKATDVLGPRWTPREAGTGPAYRRM